jgi:8-oxo-dGTP pyrophosphatase MutT (NUDIX family)
MLACYYSDTMNKISHDSETPAQGQQVITACALIHYDFDGVTKIFLPKRAATKKFLPSVFEIPGGHIDFGEDIVAGLQREIMEEFGMRISVGDAFAAFTYTNEVKGSHSAEVVYFATFADPIEQIELHPEDHSEYRWISEDQIKEIYSQQKGADDAEMVVVRKAFTLLRGERPNFE